MYVAFDVLKNRSSVHPRRDHAWVKGEICVLLEDALQWENVRMFKLEPDECFAFETLLIFIADVEARM